MLIIEKLPTRYSEGSATVVANEVTVTPTDALWYGNVWGDDRFFLPSQPLVPPQRIETVNEDGTLTLAYPWPGDSATEEPYEIRYVGIIERSTAQTRKALEQLGEVSAYYDVQVDTLADRDAFDARPAGFRVLVSDIGDGRAAIYSKASSVEADWTDPAMFSGPTGPVSEVTVGTVTTGDPGTDADVTATPVEGGVKLDFTIPAGEGFSAEGDYDGGTSYAKGDVVQQAGSSWIALQATTGNAPPSLPTTNNAYWQLLARRGTDGAGTVTAVAAGQGVSVDANDPTEPVVALDIMGESVKTANYTLVAADYGGTFIADDTDPIEFAFEAAATLGAKWWAVVKNIGAGDLTLNPDGSETINGLPELVLKTEQSVLVTCNGTELRALFEGGGGGGDDDAAALVFDQRIQGLLLADLAGEAVFLGPDGSAIHDAFADLDYVDVGGADNLDTSVVGELRVAKSVDLIPQGTGTIIGNMVDGSGGIDKAFDGNVGAAAVSAGLSQGSGVYDGWVGKTYSPPRKIHHALTWGRTDLGTAGYLTTSTEDVTLRLYGKNGAAPSSHNDGTLLASLTFSNSSSTTNDPRELVSSDQTTEFEHVWVSIQNHSATSRNIWMSELEFYEMAGVADLTVSSNPIVAAEAPDWVRVAVRMRDGHPQKPGILIGTGACLLAGTASPMPLSASLPVLDAYLGHFPISG